MSNDVLLFDAVRTPRGRARPSGGLYEVPPHVLVAFLLEALQHRVGFEPAAVADLLLGCVTPIGDQGYNIAQASLAEAGWLHTVAGVQMNRYCASGLESVHAAAARIAAGWDDLLVAGGVESMSRVPLGSDGGPLLRDPGLILKSASLPQGVSADLIATSIGISRAELDEFALASQQKAARATEESRFSASLVPIHDPNGILLLESDEHPRPQTTAEALAVLSPAFARVGADGFDQLALTRFPELPGVRHLHTAGNSSGLVDGAAVTLLGSTRASEMHGLKPRAKLRAVAVASSDPTLMLLGMIPATELALKRASLEITDVDLVEVNEAFAVVPLAFMRHFSKLDPDRVNVNGGAIALGHPVGATGCILLGTALDELERRDKTTALVTLCAGGGQGIAAIIERT